MGTSPSLSSLRSTAITYTPSPGGQDKRVSDERTAAHEE
jgi:hypothetical protein